MSAERWPPSAPSPFELTLGSAMLLVVGGKAVLVMEST